MLFRLLLPLFALLLVAAAKKPPEVVVRFHLQANPQDGSSFIMPLPVSNSAGPAYIKKVPEISELHIDAIFPFTADDGTLGCALKLNPSGRLALDALSVEERGRVLVCFVGTRLVTAILIDKRVQDGILTIPAGLSQAEVALLEGKYRIIGQLNLPKKKRR